MKKTNQSLLAKLSIAQRAIAKGLNRLASHYKAKKALRKLIKRSYQKSGLELQSYLHSLYPDKRGEIFIVVRLNQGCAVADDKSYVLQEFGYFIEDGQIVQIEGDTHFGTYEVFFEKGFLETLENLSLVYGYCYNAFKKISSIETQIIPDHFDAGIEPEKLYIVVWKDGDRAITRGQRAYMLDDYNDTCQGYFSGETFDDYTLETYTVQDEENFLERISCLQVIPEYRCEVFAEIELRNGK